jgi:hypothetical protein
VLGLNAFHSFPDAGNVPSAEALLKDVLCPVGSRGLVRAKTDAFSGWQWGREEERFELLIEIAEAVVVGEEIPFDALEAGFDGGVGEHLAAHADESADDVDTHGNGAFTVEHRGGHEGAVLGEDPWLVALSTMGY